MTLAPLLAALLAAQPTPRTLRVDYVHGGDAATEMFSLDRLVLEPLPFPGNPARPIDETNLGRYLFEVRDRATNRLLYSRGFATIFGEWETTPEAKRVRRSFSESLRFPRPAGPVQVSVKKRDAENAFREVWTFTVDPADPAIDPSPPPSPGPLVELQRSGPPEQKLDLLILGDGYTAKERDKFVADARKLTEALFQKSPFKERRKDFNVWGLCPPAQESGVSRPSSGVHRRSPLGAGYDAFGAERYVLTFENRTWRDVASYAPYDAVEILVNGRTYGGGGIFNLYATAAADSLWAPYVFVHELGHHLAGLADEYFTSDPVYGPAPEERVEPWERNASATADPAKLKWRALVTAGTPLPTPWQEERFSREARTFQEERKKLRQQGRPEEEIDRLFSAQKRAEEELLGKDRYGRAVGAFEGANYEAKGYFRPQEDCVMFTRDDVPFCAVCRATLDEVIDLYAGAPR
ncbi:IgA Peptidase M64 [Anaeromyxobacter paludicola]|uniref:Peptidase M64 N-terminal domain-containing protein n=1 Tax=Anaeromyxobacter paludicola TaxID=2918171 RepID=A0ABM7XDM6_9BACT|nr:IgA Peptidase M64 [Anaeromyxobacter paludicola]BDG09958.1 hypothetical protein AMPC_30710 [Anaeromyxobacter paludicola]